MRLFSLILAGLLTLSLPATAQDIHFDIDDTWDTLKLPYSPNAGSLPLNRDGREQVRRALKHPEVAARFDKAFAKTYRGSAFFDTGNSDSPLSANWIEHDGKVILLRLFISFREVSDHETFFRGFDAWLTNVMGEPVNRPLTEIARDAWARYEPLESNDNYVLHVANGWINLTSTPNRAMAWGLPDHYIEIVITTRPDCAFIADDKWYVRQICG
jgi:hypothetical protein